MAVGDGDLYAPLSKMAAHRHAGDKIILTGKVPFDDMPSYLAAADICLLPAHINEIMMNIVPIKMYEYMAMGKPVIATKLPGIIQEFGFENGIVYVDKSDDTLNKAEELIATKNVRGEGEKARRAVENQDWDSITDEFERTLRDVLDSHTVNKVAA
jgi:glycosyltransferase involved in cell wall biosynthesis